MTYVARKKLKKPFAVPRIGFLMIPTSHEIILYHNYAFKAYFIRLIDLIDIIFKIK